MGAVHLMEICHPPMNKRVADEPNMRYSRQDVNT